MINMNAASGCHSMYPYGWTVCLTRTMKSNHCTLLRLWLSCGSIWLSPRVENKLVVILVPVVWFSEHHTTPNLLARGSQVWHHGYRFGCLVLGGAGGGV